MDTLRQRGDKIDHAEPEGRDDHDSRYGRERNRADGKRVAWSTSTKGGAKSDDSLGEGANVGERRGSSKETDCGLSGGGERPEVGGGSSGKAANGSEFDKERVRVS
jgi:hypothetical protein